MGMLDVGAERGLSRTAPPAAADGHRALPRCTAAAAQSTRRSRPLDYRARYRRRRARAACVAVAGPPKCELVARGCQRAAHSHSSRAQAELALALQNSPADSDRSQPAVSSHAANIVIFPYLDDVHVGDGGLVVLPGSHKSTLPRPGHKNDLPPLYSSSPADWSTQLPRGLVNVAPVSAGDFLILSEATVHGILPWAPRDRLRRFLVLRFGMQYSGSQPLLNLPPQCRERLSDTTRELMDYAHITHTKQIAMEYRIRNAGPRL
eukprot:COSAG01_NODE_8871_length_2631_cov_1.543049_3_plen_263_part_00